MAYQAPAAQYARTPLGAASRRRSPPYERWGEARVVLAPRWISRKASGGVLNFKGINRAEWLRLDKALYDACLDPADYRKQARK
jgi:hypothetical protein